MKNTLIKLGLVAIVIIAVIGATFVLSGKKNPTDYIIDRRDSEYKMGEIGGNSGYKSCNVFHYNNKWNNDGTSNESDPGQ
ncbi:MAG TPA: hypothetical protein VFD89_05050 [Clostridia bacterium]|nr:hypothetical protein [Clostridia bacterium]